VSAGIPQSVTYDFRDGLIRQAAGIISLGPISPRVRIVSDLSLQLLVLLVDTFLLDSNPSLRGSKSNNNSNGKNARVSVVLHKDAAEKKHHALIELVPAMLVRREYLFGPPPHVSRLGKVIFQQSRRAFSVHPELLLPILVPLCVSRISQTVALNHRNPRAEFIAHICSLVTSHSGAMERASRDSVKALDDIFNAIVMMLQDFVSRFKRDAQEPDLQRKSTIPCLCSSEFCSQFLTASMQLVMHFGERDSNATQQAQFCLAQVSSFAADYPRVLAPCVVCYAQEGLRRLQCKSFN
jgi:hypothetical protein